MRIQVTTNDEEHEKIQKLPSLIDEQLFDFWSEKTKQKPYDLYIPGNNILSLPSDVIYFSLMHIKPKILPTKMNNYTITLTKYKKKDFIIKCACPKNSCNMCISRRETYYDNKNNYKKKINTREYSSRDVVINKLFELYKARKIYIQCHKMKLINNTCRKAFGDLPSDFTIQCCGFDIDNTLLESKIKDRIKNTNNIYKIHLLNNNYLIDHSFESLSLISKVVILEQKQNEILEEFQEKTIQNSTTNNTVFSSQIRI